MTLEEINIDELNIEELKELYEAVGTAIYEWNDGYIYICEISSFGTTFQQVHTNFEMVEELSWEYNGDRGILDVYTTNKDLETDLYISGGIHFIESQESFEKWKDAMKRKNVLDRLEEDHRKYDEWVESHGDAMRDIYTGSHRPIKPHTTREEIEERRAKFNALEYDEPILINSTTQI